MKNEAALSIAVALCSAAARAEIVEFSGSPDALPHQRYVHVVSERDSPIEQIYIKAKDGVYIAAAIRKPRGDHYRGGDFDSMNTPSTNGLVTAIDDGVSVIEHVRALPYVDGSRVSVYGVQMPAGGARPDLATLRPDPAVADANIAPIATPILMLVGTADPLLAIDRTLHEALATRGKGIRMEIYEHGHHDFVLGPQGQTRPDLPKGEILLQGALDALEHTVLFVKAPR